MAEIQLKLVKSKLSKTLCIMYKASKLINYEGMFTLTYIALCSYRI